MTAIHLIATHPRCTSLPRSVLKVSPILALIDAQCNSNPTMKSGPNLISGQEGGRLGVWFLSLEPTPEAVLATAIVLKKSPDWSKCARTLGQHVWVWHLNQRAFTGCGQDAGGCCNSGGFPQQGRPCAAAPEAPAVRSRRQTGHCQPASLCAEYRSNRGSRCITIRTPALSPNTCLHQSCSAQAKHFYQYLLGFLPFICMAVALLQSAGRF